MPTFGDRMSDEEIVDVIAWFQDRWHDEIYAQWWQIEQRSKQ
jgi:mono/diheme cytochrome c family protein